MTTREYVDTYKQWAINDMHEFGIPASITLAQGLLESGNGGSTLAVKGNNHFGIKCKGDWTGRKIYHDDDEKGECFRQYRNAEHSYRDHAKFLRESPRYASLFKLQPTDYKGWARGLKAAGYATNPKYAELLISLIEKNELYRYDRSDGKERGKTVGHDEFNTAGTAGRHQRYLNNGSHYVVARQGDSFASLAAEFDLSQRKVLKYNDLRSAFPLTAGTRLYIEPKGNKAERGVRQHRIVQGDSYYGIAQQYGIKLKRLERMNPVTMQSPPEVGRTLRLR
jgi:LysM repeat protein